MVVPNAALFFIALHCKIPHKYRRVKKECKEFTLFLLGAKKSTKFAPKYIAV